MFLEFGKSSPITAPYQYRSDQLRELGESNETINLLNSVSYSLSYSIDDAETLLNLDAKYDIPIIQALINPSYDAIQRLVRNGCQVYPTGISAHFNFATAIQNSDYPMVRWGLTHITDLPFYIYELAIMYGNLPMFQFIQSITQRRISEIHMKYAAQYGSLNILQYFHQQNAPWNEFTFEAAALNQHLSVVKYLILNGCPFKKFGYTSAYASQSLEIAKFVYEHYPVVDNNCLAKAIYNGSFDIVQFIVEHGCPLMPYAMGLAALGGHYDIVVYLHKKGCPWDAQSLRCAVEREHAAIVTYMLDNGCPVMEETPKLKVHHLYIK